MVPVPLKSYISVYHGIYFNIPHLVQVVEIPDFGDSESEAAAAAAAAARATVALAA